MSLRERIDAAMKEWVSSEPHERGYLGDCAARNEMQVCCLDVEHENYDKLLDFLARRLSDVKE
jgi:hypothetical protein